MTYTSQFIVNRDGHLDEDWLAEYERQLRILATKQAMTLVGRATLATVILVGKGTLNVIDRLVEASK